MARYLRDGKSGHHCRCPPRRISAGRPRIWVSSAPRATFPVQVLIDFAAVTSPRPLQRTPGRPRELSGRRDHHAPGVQHDEDLVALFDAEGLTHLLGNDELALAAESYRFRSSHTDATSVRLQLSGKITTCSVRPGLGE